VSQMTTNIFRLTPDF